MVDTGLEESYAFPVRPCDGLACYFTQRTLKKSKESVIVNIREPRRGVKLVREQQYQKKNGSEDSA